MGFFFSHWNFGLGYSVFDFVSVSDAGISIFVAIRTGGKISFFFFLSGFSLTTIHESQVCRGRGRAFL